MNPLVSLTLAALLLCSSAAVAHPQTERFIPIGQSPGTGALSGTIDSRSGTRIVLDGKQITLGQNTPVWVYKSNDRPAGVVGVSADCRPGSFVEIRYHVEDGNNVADWVKVRD